MQSLELLLDAASEERIRRQWELLAEAGLPSLAHHTSATNRPHLTLDARDTVSPDREARLVEVATLLPVEVRIGAPLLFHNRRGHVLVRHVLVTSELMAVHARAHAVLGPGGSPLSAPGAWVPHVSLAHGLSSAQVAAALDLLTEHAPVRATASRLRRWDSPGKRAWMVAPAVAPAESSDVSAR